MELTKEFVNSCNRPSILREFLLQAMDQIDAMEEERRWRKYSEEKPQDGQEVWAYDSSLNNRKKKFKDKLRAKK